MYLCALFVLLSVTPSMYCLILLIGSIQLRHDIILIFRSYKTKHLYTKWGHIILLSIRIYNIFF
jgi:hypothetical protein